MQVRMPAGKLVQLVAEDDVLQVLAGVDQVDPAVPALVGQVADRAHQRRDADPAPKEYDAIGFDAAEGEAAVWAGRIEEIAFPYVLVEVTRHDAAAFVLDRQVAPAVAAR